MVKVYGHPRSGCNFAVSFIASAFYPEIAEQKKVVWTGHWSNRVQVEVKARDLWGSHVFWCGQSNCIYVMRDVRDMALSMYHTKQFQHKSWHDLDFSAFIRKPLDWRGTPGNGLRKKDMNIIEHWCKHVQSWSNRDKVSHIRYRDLVKAPGHVIDMVSCFTGQEMVTLPDLSLVGPFPHKGMHVGKWRGRISKDDLAYIEKTVGDEMWRMIQ